MKSLKTFAIAALVLASAAAPGNASRIWQEINDRAPLQDVFERLRDNAPLQDVFEKLRDRAP